MKNINYRYSIISLFTALTLLFAPACERDINDLSPATFPTDPNVFIDGFSAGLNYAAFGGSNVTAFDVDNVEKYRGTASMMFAVPDAGEAEGAYAGGTFYTTIGRDLSSYDALTFYAKATKAATIDLIGFGNDLGQSKYIASLSGVKVNTNWKKYIIPIPNPSKLINERGMFFYSEGPEDGQGYTFWIDEVKFEKLGTLAHPKPSIMNGEDKTVTAFNNTTSLVDGLGYTVNLPNGVDQTVNVAPAYFNFSTSDEAVATVNENGLVSILSEGSATITASFGDDVEADGSLTVQSSGSFDYAPTPTLEADEVISIFSNAYTNVPVDFYNGYWEPWQTTLSADFTINGDDVLNYTNFNFVGIQFASQTINAANMTHLHMDVFIPNAVSPQDALEIEVVDFGADGTADDPNNSIKYQVPSLVSQQWISVDIPLSGLATKNHLAQLIFSNLGTSLSNYYLDNVYLYGGNGGGGGGTTTEPTEAAPAPTVDAADVISLFSDAYTNLEGTDYPDWGQTTVVSNESVAGNSTLKFTGLNYQGIQLASSLDVSSMEYLHIDYWTQNSTELNAFLISSGPVETAFALTVPTDGWNSLDIPLSSFSPVDLADIIQLKFDGNGDIFIDNLYFAKGDGGGGGSSDTEPTTAAPAPTQDAANVVSLFSNAYTDQPVSTWSAEWDDSDVADLQVAGDDVKKYTFTNFAGIDFSSDRLDLSEMTNFHMDIWTPDEVLDKSLSIKCVDFGGGNAEASNFILTVTHSAAGDVEALAKGTWVSIDVPMTAFAGTPTRSDLAQIILTCNLSTVYIDNLYFYGDGGNGGGGSSDTEPTAAAPAPGQDAANVISLFSDAYTDVPVDTWRTDWSAATFEDVTVAGNAAKKYSALDFVGIETTSNQIDASAMTHVHLDVWTADATSFAIKLVDFGANAAYDGGDDSEHQITFENPTQGEWVSYDIPLSDFTGLAAKNHLAQYILVAQPSSAATVWIDNFYFYGDGGTGGGGGGTSDTEPATAAPVPTHDAGEVISIFSDSYTDITDVDYNPNWGQTTTVSTGAIDGNNYLLYSGLNYQGTDFSPNHQDVSTKGFLHLDYWTANSTALDIYVISPGKETPYALTVPTNGNWNSVDIPLSVFADVVDLTDVFQFKFDGNGDIYIDNLYFHGEGNYGGGGGGTVEVDPPTTPAPTPAVRNAEDVISFFSNAYTNTTVDAWSAVWDDSDVADIQVAGDDVKQVTFTNFLGIDFSNNKFDATEMTRFHMDIWTPNEVLDKVITAKMVDFGGGEAEASSCILTITHGPSGEIPALATGAWVSIDVPISAFSGDQTRSDLAQLVMTSNLQTVFIDNMYLYK